jgi:hypothetical protein
MFKDGNRLSLILSGDFVHKKIKFWFLGVPFFLLSHHLYAGKSSSWASDKVWFFPYNKIAEDSGDELWAAKSSQSCFISWCWTLSAPTLFIISSFVASDYNGNDDALDELIASRYDASQAIGEDNFSSEALQKTISRIRDGNLRIEAKRKDGTVSPMDFSHALDKEIASFLQFLNQYELKKDLES